MKKSTRNLPAIAISLVSCVSLSNCGGTTDPGNAVASVEIEAVLLESARALHSGDTLTLGAVVRDASGNTLQGVPITWESRDLARGTIGNTNGLLTIGRAVSITEDGVITDPNTFYVVATAGQVQDSIELNFNGWNLAVSTDDRAEASLLGLPGADGPFYLHVRCEESRVDVFISVEFDIGSGTILYRPIPRPSRVQNWVLSPDLKSVQYPDDDDSGFAQSLMQEDSVLFRLEKASGGESTTTFILLGILEVVPRVLNSCF